MITYSGTLLCDDTKYMISALRDIGCEVIRADVDEEVDTPVYVKGGVHRFQTPAKDIFIGNSGTCARFLSSLFCLVPGDVTIRGDEHMAKRPIDDLIEGLEQMGVSVECPTGCPPLTIKSNELPGGEIEMNGSKSSQYFTSVMLSAPMAKNDVKLKIRNKLVSAPYVLMTAEMMRQFGAQVEIKYDDKNENIKEIFVKAQPYAPVLTANGEFFYTIEADASASSYAFAAAAVTGQPVRVHTGVQYGKSLQGDFAFVDILERMGCQVVKEGHYITIIRPKNLLKLRGVNEDMFNISDTVMTLAAISPLCDGPTKITNIANIRIKETDRLIATVNELKRLGQKVEFGEDWLEISPQEIIPAEIECYSDHRMAMSFAILGLVRPGIKIKDRKCVAKTYPNFWEHLETFKAKLKE